MTTAAPSQSTLIENASVSDGTHEGLTRHANVLIEANVIRKVSTGAITAPEATVIDAGGGRVMTPGGEPGVPCDRYRGFHVPEGRGLPDARRWLKRVLSDARRGTDQESCNTPMANNVIRIEAADPKAP